MNAMGVKLINFCPGNDALGIHTVYAMIPARSSTR